MVGIPESLILIEPVELSLSAGSVEEVVPVGWIAEEGCLVLSVESKVALSALPREKVRSKKIIRKYLIKTKTLSFPKTRFFLKISQIFLKNSFFLPLYVHNSPITKEILVSGDLAGNF